MLRSLSVQQKTEPRGECMPLNGELGYSRLFGVVALYLLTRRSTLASTVPLPSAPEPSLPITILAASVRDLAVLSSITPFILATKSSSAAAYPVPLGRPVCGVASFTIGSSASRALANDAASTQAQTPSCGPPENRWSLSVSTNEDSQSSVERSSRLPVSSR